MMLFDDQLMSVVNGLRKHFLILLLFCAYSAQANTFLPFNSSYKSEKQPMASLKMLNTKEGWTISNSNIINGSFSEEHFWIRITPDTLSQNAVIIIENGHIDTLDVYIYDKEQHLVKKYHSGDLVLFKNRYIPYHYFNFYIPKEATTILMHSRSKGSLLHPIKMVSAEDPSYFLHDNTINLIFFGVLLLALVINLMFAVFLKDSIYLYYSLYLVGVGINYANDLELLFQYIWPAHPEVNQYNLLIYSLTFLIFFFSEKFLQLKSNSRTLYIIFQVLYVLIIANGIISLYSYPFGVIGITILLIVGPVLAIVASLLIFIRKREIQILIFFLAWSFYMTAVFTYALSVASIIPYFNGQEKLLIIGTTLEIIMLMIAVVYKFNMIREEGMKTKERLIKALYENEKILSNQNVLLEEKIKERTTELEQKNIQLEQQSNQLEDQNKIIESANRLLKDNQAYLEQLVQERTEELTQSNKELLRRNDRLEQFSFVAAHNIRGPLSTLLGLSNLYYMEKGKNINVDSEFYLQKMKESGEKLDVVVHALNSILDLDNLKAGESHNISLDRVIKELVSQNEILLKGNKVTINTDFSEQPLLWVIPLFFTSILYQLIENAIKFKKDNSDPEIFIKSSKKEGYNIIEFTDNSQGIDLVKEKDNIFQPFKKLQHVVSGNGIGLYMVQRQIHAMGATIELKSNAGAGCRYIMSFPAKD